MSQTKLNDDRLVIGLDFGTTFTGVAACYSNMDNIDVIKTWPGGNGVTSEKVPTELSYDNGFRWGFQIKPGDKRITCIKLHLERESAIPAFASKDDALKLLRDSGRTAVEAASDYLTEIFKHAMETINKRYGKALVENTEKEVIITVPAVWSDFAKDQTLSAAKKAGMGKKLRMISEPEAAACYTLRAIQPNHLKVGNNMVVCDAGGGTVDLITYRITRLEPLALEESSVGTGDLCGAAFLNDRFENHVRNRLGQATFTHMIREQPKTWQTALKYFEDYVKRSFNEEDEEEFNVPFPSLGDIEEAGVECGFMVLTSQDVRTIFDSIVNRVVGLIKGQVNAVQHNGGTVSAILLVGGFGQSIYLYQRAKAYFDSASPPPHSPSSSQATLEDMTECGFDEQEEQARAIPVMQPINAWTAVVRGAVLRGLEGNIVTDRRSRYHYGSWCSPVFDPNIHPLHTKYWDDLFEEFRARDAMVWCIEKNEMLGETRQAMMHFCRKFRGATIPTGRDLENVKETLCASIDNKAPVIYDGISTIRVCTLTADLRAVPSHYFVLHVNSAGETFRVLSFTLEMRIESAELGFAMKIGGVEYGSVAANFIS